MSRSPERSLLPSNLEHTNDLSPETHRIAKSKEIKSMPECCQKIAPVFGRNDMPAKAHGERVQCYNPAHDDQSCGFSYY